MRLLYSNKVFLIARALLLEVTHLFHAIMFTKSSQNDEGGFA